MPLLKKCVWWDGIPKVVSRVTEASRPHGSQMVRNGQQEGGKKKT